MQAKDFSDRERQGTFQLNTKEKNFKKAYEAHTTTQKKAFGQIEIHLQVGHVIAFLFCFELIISPSCVQLILGPPLK